jgi:hypothetical protein
MLQAHLLDGHWQHAIPLIVDVFANEIDSTCGDQLRLSEQEEQVAVSALTGHRSVSTHLERERTPLDHRQTVIGMLLSACHSATAPPACLHHGDQSWD